MIHNVEKLSLPLGFTSFFGPLICISGGTSPACRTSPRFPSLFVWVEVWPGSWESRGGSLEPGGWRGFIFPFPLERTSVV